MNEHITARTLDELIVPSSHALGGLAVALGLSSVSPEAAAVGSAVSACVLLGSFSFNGVGNWFSRHMRTAPNRVRAWIAYAEGRETPYEVFAGYDRALAIIESKFARAKEGSTARAQIESLRREIFQKKMAWHEATGDALYPGLAGTFFEEALSFAREADEGSEIIDRLKGKLQHSRQVKGDKLVHALFTGLHRVFKLDYDRVSERLETPYGREALLGRIESEMRHGSRYNSTAVNEYAATSRVVEYLRVYLDVANRDGFEDRMALHDFFVRRAGAFHETAPHNRWTDPSTRRGLAHLRKRVEEAIQFEGIREVEGMKAIRTIDRQTARLESRGIPEDLEPWEYREIAQDYEFDADEALSKDYGENGRRLRSEALVRAAIAYRTGGYAARDAGDLRTARTMILRAAARLVGGRQKGVARETYVEGLTIEIPDPAFEGLGKGMVAYADELIAQGEEGEADTMYEITRLASEALLDLSYGREIALAYKERFGDEDLNPFKVLNAFLRHRLGRAPRERDVEELTRLGGAHYYWLDFVVANTRFGQPVFQIYTKEYLDAYASHLANLARQFAARHGRRPMIVEVAAGDGLFARLINQRLPEGMRVHPTDDYTGSEKWKLVYDASVVKKKDAVAAAKDADIIVAHWLPIDGSGRGEWELHEELADGTWIPDGNVDDPSQPLDLRLAYLLKLHPDKILMVTGANCSQGCTGSDEFRAYAGERLEGRLLEEIPASSRLDFGRGDPTSVEIYRSPR